MKTHRIDEVNLLAIVSLIVIESFLPMILTKGFASFTLSQVHIRSRIRVNHSLGASLSTEIPRIAATVLMVVEKHNAVQVCFRHMKLGMAKVLRVIDAKSHE